MEHEGLVAGVTAWWLEGQSERRITRRYLHWI